MVIWDVDGECKRRMICLRFCQYRSSFVEKVRYVSEPSGGVCQSVIQSVSVSVCMPPIAGTVVTKTTGGKLGVVFVSLMTDKYTSGTSLRRIPLAYLSPGK